MSLKVNKIYNEDCLETLKRMESNSVDLVLTDPPYGTSDKSNKVVRRGESDVEFGSDWDTAMPTKYIEHLSRIMKPDRWGCIFTDKKEITTLWDCLKANDLTPRHTFYWVKTNKAPTPRSNFKSCVETAVVFTKGRTDQHWYGGGARDNYFESPFVSGSESVDHPTQKPVSLFMYLLETFTTTGDIAYDPFLGSGTLAIACEKLNRNWVGSEISEKYCEIARKRIKIEQDQRDLF